MFLAFYGWKNAEDCFLGSFKVRGLSRYDMVDSHKSLKKPNTSHTLPEVPQICSTSGQEKEGQKAPQLKRLGSKRSSAAGDLDPSPAFQLHETSKTAKTASKTATSEAPGKSELPPVRAGPWKAGGGVVLDYP